jgi:hypothetical protein
LVNRKQFSVANFNNTKFEQLVAVWEDLWYNRGMTVVDT